jgi:uncharacterized protein
MRSRLVTIGVLALLAACASSPEMHFYTLTAIAPEAPAAGKSASLVRLERLTIPDELDRPQVVQQIDATRLNVSDQDRWAAPLDELVRRILWANLSERLPGTMTSELESARGSPARGLSVGIEQFIGDSRCTVTLRANWLITTPGAPVRRGTETIDVPSPGPCSTSALPDTMSRALGELSDRLVSALTQR